MSVGRDLPVDGVKEIQSEQLPPLPPSPEGSPSTLREQRPAPPTTPPMSPQHSGMTPPAQRPAPPTISPLQIYQDDELNEDDAFDLLDYPPPKSDKPETEEVKLARLNWAQRIAGGTVSFLETTAALVWGTGLVVEKEMDLIPVPGDYAVTALAAIGAKEALQSLRVLSRREHPFDYLFFAGGGSFVKGLAKEVGKKAAAAIPPVLFMLAASYGRQKLFDSAMADPENNQVLLPLLFLFDTPLLRSIIIGAPALLLYFAGQKIIERVIPGMQSPEIPPIDNEDTRWFQKLIDDGLLTINSMTMAGLGRELFNTLGPAIFLHSPYALLMAPVAALIILPLLHYAAEELHPFQSVQDFYYGLDPRPAPVTVLDDANGPEPEKTEGPTAGRIAANIATKAGIALGVLTLGALINRYASAAVSNVVSTNQDGVNDPGSWKPEVRIAYEVALVASLLVVQRLIEHVPQMVEAVKEHGPNAVKNIKTGVPLVMKNIGDGVANAAHASAESVKRGAHQFAEYFRPSFQGMFAAPKNNLPMTGSKVVVLPGDNKAPARIDVDEFDFDLPIDENVVEDEYQIKGMTISS